MATQTKRFDKEELIRLEKSYWQALVDNDLPKTLALTDDPCIVTGAQGVGRIDHASFEKMMKQATWRLRAFEVDDEIQVRQLGQDVAVVAYKVKEDLTVDGKPLTLEAFESSTWVRRNGSWVCAMHSESLAGDPFGRDRLQRS